MPGVLARQCLRTGAPRARVASASVAAVRGFSSSPAPARQSFFQVCGVGVATCGRPNRAGDAAWIPGGPGAAILCGCCAGKLECARLRDPPYVAPHGVATRLTRPQASQCAPTTRKSSATCCASPGCHTAHTYTRQKRAASQGRSKVPRVRLARRQLGGDCGRSGHVLYVAAALPACADKDRPDLALRQLRRLRQGMGKVARGPGTCHRAAAELICCIGRDRAAEAHCAGAAVALQLAHAGIYVLEADAAGAADRHLRAAYLPPQAGQPPAVGA